ncbi:DUF6894 family protein [Methylobacterium segetis]|uniref:DUF6894 family protein n=1 Tax=Methylobacterium segetis TaxID=2488750 RepID=UPI001051EE57|nr:hypothetical protein [Methylobacterium segetis]
MVERFYFDLVSGETVILDNRGIEAASLEMAVAAAEEALHELRDTGEVGDFDGAWTLLIRDTCGTLIRRIEIMAYLAASYLGGICAGWLLLLGDI